MSEVVEVVRRIDARPEEVWPYLTEGQLWSRWQGSRATVVAEPGGTYRMEMDNGSFASGSVVEVIPFRSITFTWGWTRAPFALEPGSTTVQITLEPDGDGTLLRLVHRDLPDELRQAHADGWNHYVSRLAVVVGGGDPGVDTAMGGG